MARQRPNTPFAYDLEASDIAAERQKARELRASQWWKRQLRQRDVVTGAGRDTGQGTDHGPCRAHCPRRKKHAGNVVPACKTCNNKKKQLLPMEWEAYVQAMRGHGKGADDA
jgi:5-methylcytosine-specific restriction enzyme A